MRLGIRLGIRHGIWHGLLPLWALLVAAGTALAQPQPRPDLLALHARAQQHAPLLHLADAELAEHAARARAAQAPLGPQLSAQWQRGRQAGTGSSALLLSQSLVNAADWAQRQAALERLAAGQAARAASEQQLRQRSAQLYVQWHAAQQQAQVQHGLSQAYAREAQRMAVRHREGLAAAVDWRQSQSFHTLAQAQALAAQQAERALRQQLVAHAGAPDWLDADWRPLGARQLPPLTLAPSAPSEAQHPTLRSLRQELVARGHEMDAARRAHWPQLSLEAQAQRPEQGVQRREGWLVLRLPLWDSGSRGAAQDAAQARHAAAQAQLAQQRLELARERATQHERLHAAAAQHGAAAAGLDAATQTVAAMRVGQEQGSRSTADVLLAIQLEGQLRHLAVQAQADAWLAWIDALAAQGALDEPALQLLNGALE